MGKSKDLATGSSTLYQTQTTSDTRYVNTAGDTMTGALTGTSAGFTGDVNIGNNASSNPLSKLRLGGTQYGAADIRPTDEGGHKVGMAFYTDGTGDTTIDPVLRMTIDSSGRVLKPYTPCFGARAYSGTTTQIASMNPLLWANVHTNVGNCFSNSTGKFTFPVAGRYYYECNVNLKSSDGSWMGLYFVYNGVGQHNSWSRDASNTDYNDTIVSGVVDAAANDYMAFCWHASYVAPSTSSNYNYASIHLIG